MIVSFPDNANIQIFVVPPGTEPTVSGHGKSELLLPPPAAPAPKRSRGRDVMFLAAGVVLCVGVLMVVQGQQSRAGRGVEPGQLSSSTSGPLQLSGEPAHPIPSASATSAGADPTATVRRLLAVPPTITPPPGVASATATAPTGTPADTGKRNSFGMRD